MARRLFSSIEPLESRIAPAALAAINPLPDIIAGLGTKNSIIDLGSMYAAQDSSAYHSIVEFKTNFDTDPLTAGLQAGVIRIELFDDVAPLTVQNFLSYVKNATARGDYDGIFFHRNPNAEIGLPVLQAGGFEVSNPSVHIPTTPVVTNEYSAAYPNIKGTLSLAKTGAGPNTGSSEFFFNMGDNSTTLGPANANSGGYAVFAQVIQGMDVLEKIFQQPVVNVIAATKNGALGTVPYQGDYNPDPDQNTATPSPALKAHQYIQITSADVVLRDAVSHGVTYKVVNVVNHDTATPNTTTLKHSIPANSDILTLTYLQSGAVDVTVEARDASNNVIGQDTFTATYKPNLIAIGAGETLQPYMGPGDIALGQVAVSNNGAAPLVGFYDVKYYLSSIPASDNVDPRVGVPTFHGLTLDAFDKLIGTFTERLSLTSGQSALLTHQITLPFDLTSEHTSYKILAEVTPAEGSAVDELYTNDQYFAGGATHVLTNTFGTVVVGNSLVRSHSSLTYLDADGQKVVATITGPGVGLVTPVYDSNQQLIGTDLDFFNTSAATVVTIKSVTPATPATGPARTTIGTVRVNPDAAYEPLPIGTLNLGLVDLTNNFFALGGVKAVTLGDLLPGSSLDPNNYAFTLTNSHQFVLGTSAPLAKVQPVVKLGHLDNTVISSDQVISSLTMKSWNNDSGQEISTLAGLKSFTVAGGLQADLEISAAFGDAAFMNTNAALTVPTAVFKVVGAMTDSTVKIAGNVGTVDLGAIRGSRFLVGADFVPSEIAQFQSIRTIASFIVRGIKGEDISMSDSQIAAANMTSIKLAGVIDTTSGNDSWGFVADKIGTYSRTGVTAAQSADGAAWDAVTRKNLTTATFDVRGQYGLRLL